MELGATLLGHSNKVAAAEPCFRDHSSQSAKALGKPAPSKRFQDRVMLMCSAGLLVGMPEAH